MAHAHHHHHANTDVNNLKAAFFLNFTFTILEIVGGVLINSVAVLSDAVHDLGDSLSLGVGWFLERYSKRESDAWYSYGYKRFSLLAALINAAVLIGGSLFILSETVPRLLNPESFDERGMILFAIGGVIVNGAAALRLRGSTSANAEVIGLHLLEDMLGWIAVLMVGIVSLFVDWPILDPLLSVGILIFVLVSVLGQFKRAARLFLQSVPEGFNYDDVRARFEAIADVESVHHLHIWSLDGEHHVFSAHLVVAEEVDRAGTVRIKCDARDALNTLELGGHIAHTTIEIEYAPEECSLNGAAHVH
jgi:cobalt-zinc-cadmium efflux system protein